jgi:F0F1-type ATP synthase membrane subunit b/b'
MNENRIQQVLEVERQAQEIHEKAVRDAQLLPIQAEQEGQAIMAETRASTEEEARRMIAKARAEEETARILSKAEQMNRESEALALSNFDRAVAYVLERIVTKG